MLKKTDEKISPGNTDVAHIHSKSKNVRSPTFLSDLSEILFIREEAERLFIIMKEINRCYLQETYH